MQETSLNFLKSLLQTPSPSGFERPIQDIVRNWARPYAHEIRTDRHGNVIAVLHPGGSPLTPSPLPRGGRGEGVRGHLRIMLAGHCDQIALMVQHIDDNGFLYVQPIGGWDIQILLGQNLTVWTKEGPQAAVVSRKAPHLLTNEERNKVPQFQDIWVDIGARDRKDAEALVTPGDPVTFDLAVRDMRNGLVTSPGLDDKVGVWTVMETLRLLHDRPLAASVYFVSTVQEEIGLRGATTSAYGIHPTVGIAVDVCHATDTPGNDKKLVGDTRLGNGPVVFRGPNINPHVFDHLSDAARAVDIAVQIRGVPRATGTDANAMQLSREGVATGLIGIPNRYMHSPVEVVSLDDLEHASRLLAEFCTRVTPQQEWIP